MYLFKPRTWRKHPKYAARQAMVLFMSAVIIIQPLMPGQQISFAQGIAEGAQKGREASNEIFNSLSFPESNNGTALQLPDGSSVPMSELFQSGGANSSYQNLYGKPEADFESAGDAAIMELSQGDESAEGVAYSVFSDASSRSRPDFRHDPLFGSYDSVYDIFAGEDVDCSGGRDNHVPDYQTCSRHTINDPSCQVVRTYGIDASDPNNPIVVQDWADTTCIERSRLYQSAWGDSGATCIDMPPRDGDGCVSVPGGRVCPSDLGPTAVQGVSTLCKRIQVVSPRPDTDVVDTCEPLEQNPLCGFVGSTCNYGTPYEFVRKLFATGLGRLPAQSGYDYWIGKLEDSGLNYELIRQQFFRQAHANNEPNINEFQCQEYVDTYDCGYEEVTNDPACRIKHLLEDDFAECDEELVEVTNIEEIHQEDLEICTIALKLTECRVERDFLPRERESSRHYTRSCLIEEEVEYRLPWAATAVTAEVELIVDAVEADAEVVEQPSPENDWTAKVLFTGEGEMLPVTREVERECEPDEEAPCFDLVTVMEEVERECELGETAPCYEEVPKKEMQCSDEQRLKVELIATGHTISAQETEFPAEEENQPCFRESDDWTESTWVCLETAPDTIDGVPISQEAMDKLTSLEPMYPGAPSDCIVGQGTYHTKEYAQGDLCYDDLDGNSSCEGINGDNGLSVGGDTCAELELREAAGECVLDDMYPVEDGAGSTGFQYVWEKRYDCGETEEYEVVTWKPKYTCEGIVRCMGTECATPNRQASDDFEKAAAMLQVVQQMGNDITCDVSASGGDLSQCRVFNGEAQTCKKALGGYVDCCEKPDGVTLGDYIKLLNQTSKIQNYTTNIAKIAPDSGAFADIADFTNSVSDGVSSAFDLSKDVFTKSFDNITGNVQNVGEIASSTGGSITDSVNLVIDQFQQQLMSGARDFLVDNFSSEVANFFFQETANGVALSTGFAAALSIIGLVYTIYQIAKIIVQIVWKCSEDELTLGVDRELLKTHYVGSYCARDTIFGCIEKRRSYCTFSSPLARIFNEQARPQLGRKWGRAKRPDCQGLTLGEIQYVNWQQVDLSEWLDILKITENMPGYDAELDIDSMTGAGSFLGQISETDEDAEERLNAAERNVERLEGADLYEISDQAADELWNN